MPTSRETHFSVPGWDRKFVFRKILGLLLALGLAGQALAAEADDATAVRATYRIEYASTTHSDLRALFGAAPGAAASGPGGLVHDIDARLSGELDQVALEVDGHALLSLRLRALEVAMRIDGADAGAHAQTIARELQKQPLLVELDEEGGFAGLYVDEGMDEATRAYARALFAAVQFARPRPGGAKTWERQEDDQAGSYVARYTRSTESVKRERLRYLPAKAPVKGEPGVTQVIAPTGSTQAQFDKQGTLLRLSGDERQVVTVNDKTIATGTTRVQLQRLRTQPVPGSELEIMEVESTAWMVAGHPEPLSAAANTDSSDASMHRTELGDDTVDSLLERLHALSADDIAAGSATALFLKFEAAVYLLPEASERLGTELAKAEANSPSMLLLSQALASIGHPQAQAALAEAVRARAQDWNALATLVPALGGVTAPTAATVDALLALAEHPDPDTARLARLALGGLARRGADESPQQAARVLDWLRASMQAAREERTRRDFLLALGNAADAASLTVFATSARDPSPAIRSAALSALRWLDAPQARELLQDAAANDPDADVRRIATQALQR